MMNDTELDNMVLKKQLSKKFPNKVNIGFGVDDNKIKGIDNFPIYDSTNGFRSSARSNIDEYMFSSREKKYDVKSGSHSSIGEVQPYYFSRHQKGSEVENTNTRFANGGMSSLYGLPQDRDITLENPTAQAMNLMGGQMTEEKMRNHIARKEGDAEITVVEAGYAAIDGQYAAFFDDPRMQNIIDDGVKATKQRRAKKTAITKEIEVLRETSETNEDDNILVTQAFPGKTTTRESDLGGGPGIEQNLTNNVEGSITKLERDPDGRDKDLHQNIRDKLLEMGLDKKYVPNKKIKTNKSFVAAVRRVLLNADFTQKQGDQWAKLITMDSKKSRSKKVPKPVDLEGKEGDK